MEDSPKKTIVIGLTGGIASGKSFIASELAKLGAELIDADKIGHEVLTQPLVVRQLVREFGDEILSSQVEGKIDRGKLGRLVFGEDPYSQRRLEQLEAIVHPLIHAEAVRRLRALKEGADPAQAVVIDAPLLLEANWAPMCDVILFVDAPRETRLLRAKQRGWTEGHFERREASQLSLHEKRQSSTHVVNSTDSGDAVRELKNIWSQL